MHPLEKNHFPCRRIDTGSRPMNLRPAALPARWFFVMAVVLAVAAATPLAVLAAGS